MVSNHLAVRPRAPSIGNVQAVIGRDSAPQIVSAAHVQFDVSALATLVSLNVHRGGGWQLRSVSSAQLFHPATTTPP